MAALKKFFIKQKLAKKQKQNRPMPQWVRMKTGNTVILSWTTLPDEIQREETPLETHQAEAVNSQLSRCCQSCCGCYLSINFVVEKKGSARSNSGNDASREGIHSEQALALDITAGETCSSFLAAARLSQSLVWRLYSEADLSIYMFERSCSSHCRTGCTHLTDMEHRFVGCSFCCDTNFCNSANSAGHDFAGVALFIALAQQLFA
ncbi:ribosomal L39 protein [Ancylostoma caninum]|uniref:Large ribosomal subunit protein eL39 n=1 Tax=Ancylostoma caninum TaxID=29170 RepID=A0A368GPJ3_ANCCA|nr:ribosomal L39 protein [Ancylostoma caninum]